MQDLFCWLWDALLLDYSTRDQVRSTATHMFLQLVLGQSGLLTDFVAAHNLIPGALKRLPEGARAAEALTVYNICPGLAILCPATTGVAGRR